MALSKAKIFFFVICILMLTTVISFFAAIAVSAQQDRIYPGVQVENLNLTNLSRLEAEKLLKEFNSKVGEKEIAVITPMGEGSFRLSEVDTQMNIAEVLEQAWQYGRTGNLLHQWQERKSLAKQGVTIPLKAKYSKEKFRAVIEKLSQDAEIKPEDARLIITSDDKIEIVPGKNGKVIDIDHSLKQMEEIIATVPEIGENPEVHVNLIVKEPTRTTADVEEMSVNGIVAHYTTFFNVQKTNRVYNIKVAAGALDGQMIKPGDTFSFNKVVGPRSKEAGYLLAPTILNNEFVDSLGGGVCQASTTLYNALLLAGIEIVERSSHSLVISYVPLGQDAAVAYGGKDLKFKNNLSSWVVLKTEVVGNRVTVKVFGDTALKKDIRITNKIVTTYPYKTVNKEDHTVPKGQKIVKQKGVNGYKVSSRKAVYQNGVQVSAQNLSSSHYKPLDHIILVGTKKVPVNSKPQDPGNNNPPGSTGNNGTTPTNPPPINPPSTPPTEQTGGTGNTGDGSGSNSEGADNEPVTPLSWSRR